MRIAISAAALSVALLLSPALAEDGQWTQVTNLPKGLNVAPGVILSILDIEPGAGIDEVRAIAQGLMAEHVSGPQAREPQSPQELAMALDRGLVEQYGGADLSPPLKEYESGVTVTTPGGDRITLSYTGRIDVNRDLAAGGQVSDDLRVDFSAPSSGQQVIGVQRRIEYLDDTKQPRIAPLVAELKGKFGEPMVRQKGSLTVYRWQFDNGVAVRRADFGDNDCWPYIGDVRQESEIDRINTRSGGDCDVVFNLTIKTGISEDHAGALAFELSDNERGKADLITDFAFFSTYVERYQQSIDGAAPKL